MCVGKARHFGSGELWVMVETDGTDRLSRASAVEASFRLDTGLYLVGSLERGVTVYNQQLRAHNLIWALWELCERGANAPKNLAVVGGGIAGLTIVACAASLFKHTRITLFEKRSELCPLQLGADTRWLHPRLYDWPSPGSRAPSAGLPVLSWSEGRASDVARQILMKFNAYANTAGKRVQLFLDVSHLRILHQKLQIEWIGTSAQIASSFLQQGDRVGRSEPFDTIIITSGFGLETSNEKSGGSSYWRNEQIGQPVLDGTRRPYLISGFGDGALVDLCRLAVSRFRQDTFLYELFGEALEAKERELLAIRDQVRAAPSNTFEIFSDQVAGAFENEIHALSLRTRTDARVIMHLSGSDGKNRSLAEVFGPSSSFQNRFIFFLLYKCGAFAATFGTLENTKAEYGVPDDHVLLRHGTKVLDHLAELFSDRESAMTEISGMSSRGPQSAARRWVPGCFPPPY